MKMKKIFIITTILALVIIGSTVLATTTNCSNSESLGSTCILKARYKAYGQGDFVVGLCRLVKYESDTETTLWASAQNLNVGEMLECEKEWTFTESGEYEFQALPFDPYDCMEQKGGSGFPITIHNSSSSEPEPCTTQYCCTLQSYTGMYRRGLRKYCSENQNIINILNSMKYCTGTYEECV